MFIQTFVECLLCRSTADGFLMVNQKRQSESNQKDKAGNDWLTIWDDRKLDTFLESYT